MQTLRETLFFAVEKRIRTHDPLDSAKPVSAFHIENSALQTVLDFGPRDLSPSDPRSPNSLVTSGFPLRASAGLLDGNSRTRVVAVAFSLDCAREFGELRHNRS